MSSSKIKIQKKHIRQMWKIYKEEIIPELKKDKEVKNAYMAAGASVFLLIAEVASRDARIRDVVLGDLRDEVTGLIESSEDFARVLH